MVGNSSSILFRYSVEGSLATDRQRIDILLILGILKRILPEQILYQGRLLVDPPLDSITRLRPSIQYAQLHTVVCPTLLSLFDRNDQKALLISDDCISSSTLRIDKRCDGGKQRPSTESSG